MYRVASIKKAKSPEGVVWPFFWNMPNRSRGLECYRGIMRYTIRIIWLVILLLSVSCNGQVSNLNEDLEKETEKSETHENEYQKSGLSGIENPQYRPGEVLVKFKDGTNEERIKDIQNKLNLKTIKVIPRINVYQMKIQNSTPVEEVVKGLQSFREVEYSEPNYVLHFHKFQ